VATPATAQQIAARKLATGSSFYYAFLFLPAPQREAITAFYAFCREVDDVVDEATDPGVAAASWPGCSRNCTNLLPGNPRIR